MQKRIFLFVFLSLSLYGSAQVKLKTKIDPISGDTLIATQRELLYRKIGVIQSQSAKLEFSIAKVAGNAAILFFGRSGDSKSYLISTGDKVELKLVDGNVVTLQAMTTEISDSDPYGNAEYWSSSYLLPNESKDMLIKSSVKYIRVHHSSGTLNFEIKEKHSTAIQESLKAYQKN